MRWCLSSSSPVWGEVPRNRGGGGVLPGPNLVHPPSSYDDDTSPETGEENEQAS